ncbi:MAG: HAMP domain-containing sensor histidine kinase [Oscillospiraceae bacterium]
MAQKRITTRWLTGSLGVIIVLLIVVEIGFAIAVHMFYYNSVQQQLEAQANTVNTLLAKYAEDPAIDYNREVRNLVENFEFRDRMELISLDAYGNVRTTSSGFAVPGRISMPDFEQAMTSPDGIGEYRGRMGDENVMALTMLSPTKNETTAAVRLIVSMQKVDRNILTLITGAILLGIIIVFFMVLSGSYFISSIVIPVGEIGKTARRIAQGDFATRLEKKNDDEIGDLCETINDMAEELATSEKLKNEFISSVSHELRTPLTAIKGWSETILDEQEVDREMIAKGMKVIISESDRLALMVEELLDFSRMQSGRMRMVIERIDLLAELEEAVLMYTERARREGILLEYEEQMDSAVVMADKNRLRQVFINTIDNAIKYSDSGGRVAVHVREDDGYALIEVQDFGCGISPVDLPKIKQKFYKANTTRRGSGIGLAVVDELVSAFGGRVDITSALNQGTCVSIRIPTLKKYEQLQQTAGAFKKSKQNEE